MGVDIDPDRWGKDALCETQGLSDINKAARKGTSYTAKKGGRVVSSVKQGDALGTLGNVLNWQIKKAQQQPRQSREVAEDKWIKNLFAGQHGGNDKIHAEGSVSFSRSLSNVIQCDS